LEYFTIGYNSLEGVISIVAGLVAGSVSLVGYGLDSLIEVTSGAALVWRLHHDLNVARREQVERTALRTVGACFIALAIYIPYESSSILARHVPPERSIAGIMIASVSGIVIRDWPGPNGELLSRLAAERCTPIQNRPTL
jgi:divalent metal cation (Fe/Co/Zn/Cd) transporter